MPAALTAGAATLMGLSTMIGTVISPLASIPSPSRNVVGPFSFYGMAIAFGVMACVALVARRMPERNFAPEVASEIAIPAVIMGVIGARLYHLITDWNWGSWWKITEGGLGIPGGIVLGVLGVIGWAKVKKYPLTPLWDIVAPGLPLAQAIGRWGNWFNQELYGKPSDLPWAVEIDEAHRVSGFENVETFHPTFLYESLWNLGLVVFLIWLDKKRVLRPGRLFAVYTAGYALGRLWVEALRIDNATEVLGVRINLWTMGTVLIVSLGFLAVSGRRAEGEDDFGNINPVGKESTSPKGRGEDDTTEARA